MSDFSSDDFVCIAKAYDVERVSDIYYEDVEGSCPECGVEAMKYYPHSDCEEWVLPRDARGTYECARCGAAYMDRSDLRMRVDTYAPPLSADQFKRLAAIDGTDSHAIERMLIDMLTTEQHALYETLLSAESGFWYESGNIEVWRMLLGVPIAQMPLPEIA